MKPGEHPEFFRFPAPAGHSRESTIILDEEGRFWHDGALVENQAMSRAFSRWIRRHPDDGRFILTNDYDWTYFQVADVPFFVESVRTDGDEATLRLSNGDEEPFSPSGLRLGPQGALYCLVKEGAYEARFRQQAQTELAPLLDTDDNGDLILRVGDRVFPIDLQSPNSSAKRVR